MSAQTCVRYGCYIHRKRYFIAARRAISHAV